MKQNNRRILTNIGEDTHLTVELNQNYDLLEILSLRFTQKEIYTSLHSDYGVVVGRISVNNGYGIPNARVSIFIPLDEVDEKDPLISSLYPYKNVNDKDDKNYRYNLLPKRKQHGGHAPTGTFPDQTDVLNREEVMEVYEKYYKYTVRTNDSGDFMIWGVPLGEQTLHVDVDLSDIGGFSLRPYDFIQNGVGENLFKNSYEYKSSEDLDSLPQIKTFNKSINVYPFWGNEELCEIGITRTDFDLSDVGVKIEPKAFLIGGVYTDSGKNSINKNCQPRIKMGRKCDLQTKSGRIEAIRFTNIKDTSNRPILEKYDLNQDIPEDGGFVFPIPMNMDYIYTNEYGEIETTNDPNKGIATASSYRFRFSLDDQGQERLRKTASYLVPNIREYEDEVNKSYAFSTKWEDYPTGAVNGDPERGILYNEMGEYYPKDYFYRMTYNKVYTVSSLHSMFYNDSGFKNDKYVGLKELVPSEEEDCGNYVTPPVNYGTKNKTFLLTVTEIILFFEYVFNSLLLILGNTVVRVIYNVGRSIDQKPIRFAAKALKELAFNLQGSTQTELSLISYPDCEICGDDQYIGVEDGINNNYSSCKLAEFNATFSGNATTYTSFVNYYQATDETDPACIANAEYFNASTMLNNINLVVNQNDYTILIENDDMSVVRELNNDSNVTDSTYLTIDPDFPNKLRIHNIDLGYVLVEAKVYIRKNTIVEQPIIVNDVEYGCALYDVPYDESYISYYYGINDVIIDNPQPGTEITGTVISNINRNRRRSDSGSKKNDTLYFYNDRNNGQDVYVLINHFNGISFPVKTKSGLSEFRNGIYTIILGSQSNDTLRKILREYFIRKKISKLFCGGIVNYSFIDNWLSGSLYFFQFKGKKNKYCNKLIHHNHIDDKYYYKSSRFKTNQDNDFGVKLWSGDKKYLGRPTTMVDLGPRDEFIKELTIDKKLDPNCSVVRSIGPSSFQSFGDIMGMAINYRLDINNSDHDINKFFDNNGFRQSMRNQKVLDGDLLQLISINNEVGIEEFDLNSPNYIGYSYQFLDPDDPQTMGVFKKNGAYGPLPITFYFDDDGERVRSCLNEPTHISNDNTTLVQGRLTESSQKVPFFLWDKKGDDGFGPYNDDMDNQSWDYTQVETQPLQGMTYGYKYNTAQDDSSDKYLLLPMTYDYDGLLLDTGNVTNEIKFNVVELTNTANLTPYHSEYPGFTYLQVTEGTVDDPISGKLYTRYGNYGTWDDMDWTFEHDFHIRKTRNYYEGRKQILSTPFMFYFGLKSGKTGVDKFIQYFGDKNAFTTED